MFQRIRLQFWRDPRGVTSLEYAIMASLVAVAIYASVVGTGNSLGSLAHGTFGTISSEL